MSLSSGSAHRASALLVSGQLARFGIQALTILVLARALGTADFGLFAMAMAVVGVAAVLGDAGLSLAAVQASELSAAQRSALFWLNTALGLALAVVVVLLADPVAALYGRPELVALVRVLSLVFLLSGVAAQFRAHLNRELRFRPLVLADVLSQAIGLVVAVVVALTGGGFWALAAQQVVAASVALVVVTVFARWRPGWPDDWRSTIPLVRFGVGTAVVQVANYVSTSIPTVLLGRWSGPDAAGFFSRAYSVFALPMSQLAAPLTRVALPLFSRVDDRARLAAGLEAAQVRLAVVLGGVFAAGAALAVPTIDLFLGPGWRPSAAAFAILSVGGVFQALGYVYYWAFLATASTRLQVAFMLPLRAAMVGLIGAGTAVAGIVGAAAGLSVGLAVIWIVLALVAAPRIGLARAGLLRVAARWLIVWTAVAAPVGVVDRLLLADTASVVRLLAGLALGLLLLAIVCAAWRRARSDLRTVLSSARLLTRRRAMPGGADN
ncbi:oligosaccharide flippase family protein [Salinibacterium soli]|uniref:Oligosaccharide flippase family protein n=1 Tax=Antiquaquibacter soli TaxID=3064523 RepID=A0ABT9BKQ7_9MICO|nr:oligosaccharide flippase family protein [Protaetiibacter sp. WY-16]MDO7881018.1 oligosaccharide flippase family protein [Protaetiibacter sp. WY-16]